jgi:hypothetical protein
VPSTNKSNFYKTPFASHIKCITWPLIILTPNTKLSPLLLRNHFTSSQFSEFQVNVRKWKRTHDIHPSALYNVIKTGLILITFYVSGPSDIPDISANVWLKGRRSTFGKAKTVLYRTWGTPGLLHTEDQFVPSVHFVKLFTHLILIVIKRMVIGRSCFDSPIGGS